MFDGIKGFFSAVARLTNAVDRLATTVDETNVRARETLHLDAEVERLPAPVPVVGENGKPTKTVRNGR